MGKQIKLTRGFAGKYMKFYVIWDLRIVYIKITFAL